LTIVVLGLWVVACGLSVFLTPLQVTYFARRNLANLSRVLAAAATSPGDTRIMLVGSSPVRIGLSAARIEQATGIPTFNLGVPDSAEFFEDYIDTVMQHLRTGDVVVVSNPLWLDPNRASLKAGCVRRLVRDCLTWRVSAFPHLNLTIQYMLKPMLLDALGPARSPTVGFHGDGIAPQPVQENKAIEPMPPPPAEMVATDLAQISRLIERFREREACPLFALGPVFVRDKERPSWTKNLDALRAAAYKGGLGPYLLSDEVAQVDRSQFGDSPEHPSINGGADWTRRIIDRLRDRTMGPCSAVMAAE
jgi:hypothetical protein